MPYIVLFLLATNVFALEVIKTEQSRKYVDLKIVRVAPDNWDTYTLTNDNLIEMTLVCAQNIVYDRNTKPFIRYRNFYNLPVYDFEFDSEKACRELGKFIETSYMAVDHENPFFIRLDIKNGNVAVIQYPDFDPYTQDGDIEDLLPKKRWRLVKDKKPAIAVKKH